MKTLEKIAKEILRMTAKDQEMRKGKWDSSVDRKNTNRMRELIDEIGWPTKSKVGLEASHAAWLLVQHADHDPEFQQRCLVLMKSAPEGEVETYDIAYLEDRVRVNTGRKQLYGTQFYENEKGNFSPRPIENIKDLDKRRAEMNLPPFKDYEERMNLSYKEWKKARSSRGKKRGLESVRVGLW